MFFESLSSEERDKFREWGHLYALCHTLPPENEPIGSVVIPTGDWFDRVRPGLELHTRVFRKQDVKPVLVISGGNSFNKDREGASAHKIVSALSRLNIPNDQKSLIVEENASQNSQEQAERIYDMLKAGAIRSPVTLVVSAYHLPRLYSTFVQTILKNEGENLHTKLYVHPVYEDWKGQIPLEDKIRREQIVPEVDRIHRYRDTGDVATEPELTRYVAWLRAEPTQQIASQDAIPHR